MDDCGSVFTDGLGEAGPGGKTGACESIQPVWQGAGVTSVEQGGELTDQVVASVQLRAVLEQPPECLGCVQAAAGRRW